MKGGGCILLLTACEAEFLACLGAGGGWERVTHLTEEFVEEQSSRFVEGPVAVHQLWQKIDEMPIDRYRTIRHKNEKHTGTPNEKRKTSTKNENKSKNPKENAEKST